MGAYTRLWQILDPGSFRELDAGLGSTDPLHFPGYGAKLKELRKKTGMGMPRSRLWAALRHRAVFVVLDSRFLMGSMGTAVGEKGYARATQQAGRRRLP